MRLRHTAADSFALQNHKLRAQTKTAPSDSSATHGSDQQDNPQPPPAYNFQKRSHPHVEIFLQSLHHHSSITQCARAQAHSRAHTLQPTSQPKRSRHNLSTKPQQSHAAAATAPGSGLATQHLSPMSHYS